MRTIIRDNYTPQLGQYHERIIIDSVNEKVWLFDCDGVFTNITRVIVENEYGEHENHAISQKFFTDEMRKAAEALSAEEGARILEDERLGERIDSAIDLLEGAIGEETTAREEADTGLQNQIDTIKAASDVVDVVGTYAELQAYDTSKLNNNDIVKVLDDETRNDDITYYRWNTSTQGFTFVGALSAYYSKDEADTLLAGKQDTLTAGANIQINNNVISATDTTYSDFTGTDGTAAGAAGLVPAPATTDAGKYLKADGTWGTISIPTVTLYSGTGQNTDGAMTQKATTDMIFVPGYSPESSTVDSRIRIGYNASSASNDGIALGRAASITQPGTGGVAIGYNAQVETTQGVAIGTSATTTYNGNQGVAIGGSSVADSLYSVALGFGSTTGTQNYVVSVGRNSVGNEIYRRIINVADAVNAHDAVTKGQLDTVAGTIPVTNNISSNDWSALWQ